MKKILIIMIMLVGVGANAQTDMVDLYNSGNTGSYNSGDTGSFNSGDTGSYNSGDTGAYNSGNTDANIMLGNGGNGNSAVGAGLTTDSSAFRPVYTSTDSSGVPKLSLEGIVLWLVGIMNQLVYVIIGAALVMFLYGILKLSFVDGQKPEAREQARRFMFWGIVSLFVMVSVWGLVRILQFTLFGSGNLILPQLK